MRRMHHDPIYDTDHMLWRARARCARDGRRRRAAVVIAAWVIGLGGGLAVYLAIYALVTAWVR